MPLDPVGGAEGGGAAPGTFRVIGQRPDVIVRSATDVIDAETITVEENLYGVVFSFSIPKAEWKGMGTQGEAALYASWVQAIGAMPEVVGLTYSQDVTRAGLLRDVLVITVGTPDGQHEADLTWPLRTLNSGEAFGAVRAAYKTLTDTAALT